MQFSTPFHLYRTSETLVLLAFISSMWFVSARATRRSLTCFASNERIGIILTGEDARTIGCATSDQTISELIWGLEPRCDG